VGTPVGPKGAPDSEDVLPALLGESKKGRQFLVEQAGGLSLRDGQWKYIEPGAGEKMSLNTNMETGADREPQLYDLGQDLGERKNLASSDAARVKQMVEKLRSMRGR